MNILNNREYKFYIFKGALAIVTIFLLAALCSTSLDEFVLAFTVGFLAFYLFWLHEINQRDEDSSAALMEILINESKSRTNIDKIK